MIWKGLNSHNFLANLSVAFFQSQNHKEIFLLVNWPKEAF